MKVKLLAVLLFVALAASLTVQIVSAQTNYVSGSISADSTTVVVHGSVTLTCTYTSTLNVQGSGSLEMSGPATSSTGPFKSWNEINSWDTVDSGVPVTYTQQLDTAGYYKIRWLCSGGGVDGAYTYVIIHVVNTTVLPEAPPLAAIAAAFAAGALCIAAAKKKGAEVSTKLLK